LKKKNLQKTFWFVPSVSQPDLRLRARLVSEIFAPPLSGAVGADAAVVVGSLGWLSDMTKKKRV
jgi:hypothetical protein